MLKWQIEFNNQQEERKQYLNKVYPKNKIQNIHIVQLRKIGYAVGLGSTLSKKDFIDRLITMQNEDNPIIIEDDERKYIINHDVKLLEYIGKE